MKFHRTIILAVQLKQSKTAKIILKMNNKGGGLILPDFKNYYRNKKCHSGIRTDILTSGTK